MNNTPKHYQNTAKANDPTGDVMAFIHNYGLNFNRGNAVKYLSRAGRKDPGKEMEDLAKALTYIKREIENLRREIKSEATEIHDDRLEGLSLRERTKELIYGNCK